jgi:HD-GYP domain-containing protein (c-di-GMP phosphodiesterase class II)
MSAGIPVSRPRAYPTFRLLVLMVAASVLLSTLVGLIGAEQSRRQGLFEAQRVATRHASAIAERAAPLLRGGDDLRLSVLAATAADLGVARILVLDQSGRVQIDTGVSIGADRLQLVTKDGPLHRQIDDEVAEACAPSMDGTTIVGEVRLRYPRSLHAAAPFPWALFGASFLVSLSLIALACMASHHVTSRITEAARVARQLARGEWRASCQKPGSGPLLELQDGLRELGRAVMAGVDRVEAGVIDLARTLVDSMEHRGQLPPGHCERTTRYALLLCDRLGLLPDDRRDVELASRLHDLGKVGVRSSVLYKRTPLTDDERQSLQEHAPRGAHFLECSAGLERVAAIVRHHHEKYDGTGYPGGLRGDRIPLGARIVAIADAYDVLTSRSYRGEPQSWPAALDQLRDDRGTHFDPWLLDLFEEEIRKRPLPARPVRPVMISTSGVVPYKVAEPSKPAEAEVEVAPPDDGELELLLDGDAPERDS